MRRPGSNPRLPLDFPPCDPGESGRLVQCRMSRSAGSLPALEGFMTRLFPAAWRLSSACAFALLPFAAHAAANPALHPASSRAASPGDTAWLLTATALVLSMTLPGLVAFYSGLVRSKNVLSVAMQCF